MVNKIAKYFFAVLLLACKVNHLSAGEESNAPERTVMSTPITIKAQDIGKSGIFYAGSGKVFTVSNKAGYPVRVALVKTTTRGANALKGKIRKHVSYKELYIDKNGTTQVKIMPSADDDAQSAFVENNSYTAFTNFDYSPLYDRTLWVARFSPDLNKALNKGFIDKNDKVVAYNIGGRKDFVTINPGLKFSTNITVPAKLEDRLVSTIEFTPTSAEADNE